jgi:ADP-ribosyl-[dinitrogen reductase] hydrolase
VIVRCIETGTPLTPELFADHFVECFQRDVRAGYAGGFYNFLLNVADGEEFLRKIKPYSDKSGGAMRAVPAGIFPTINQVLTVAALQGAITHNTTDGINAAKAAALMGHYFLYDLGAKQQLGAFVEKWVPGDWATPWKDPVGEKGWMSVRAAITAIERNDTLSGLLTDCIAFTGDVDTVGAIALGAAAASKEYAHDLPMVLFDELENGAFGLDYLDKQDRRLEAAIEKLRLDAGLAQKVACDA